MTYDPCRPDPGDSRRRPAFALWEDRPDLLTPNEPVVVTEILDGAEVACAWADGRMVAGNPALDVTALIEDLCPGVAGYLEGHPDDAVFGTLYGDGKYGVPAGELRFAAHDVCRRGDPLPYATARAETFFSDVPWVPELKVGRFSPDLVPLLRGGVSRVPGAGGYPRYGALVRATRERRGGGDRAAVAVR